MFAEISKTVSTDFGWLPFMDYVYIQLQRDAGQGDRRQDRRSWPDCRPGRTTASSTPRTRASPSPDPAAPRRLERRARPVNPPRPERGQPCPPLRQLVPPTSNGTTAADPPKQGLPRPSGASTAPPTLLTLPFFVIFLAHDHRSARLRRLPVLVQEAADRRRVVRRLRELRASPDRPQLPVRRRADGPLPGRPGAHHAGPGTVLRAGAGQRDDAAGQVHPGWASSCRTPSRAWSPP